MEYGQNYYGMRNHDQFFAMIGLLIMLEKAGGEFTFTREEALDMQMPGALRPGVGVFRVAIEVELKEEGDEATIKLVPVTEEDLEAVREERQPEPGGYL